MREARGRQATTANSIEVIRGWLVNPQRDKGIYLADESDGWHFRSYADLARDALACARSFGAHGVTTGDGVCVVLPTDLTCAAAFYGVWAAGGVLTPVAPPTFADLDLYTAHVAAIIAQAQPRLIVTIPDLAEIMTTARERAGHECEVFTLTAPAHPAEQAAAHEPEALAAVGEVALLQFTSGSTGNPRGVRISWDNLATNTAMISELLCWEADEPMASWLPLYHDMGLVGGFLTTVTNQEDLYLMRPDQFVRDPARWLRAMTIARHTPSPSFALGYLAHRVQPEAIADLDLSRWRSLAVGSEPVELSDLQSFTALVAGCGFDSNALTLAYGLAESTLMVSGSRRGQPITLLRPASSGLRFGQPVGIDRRDRFGPDRQYRGTGWIAGLGCSTDDSVMEVVDDDGRLLPDGVLGEVTVRGGSVALGYSVGAEPRDAVGTTRIIDGVLYTGDAGFRSDGELFVIGRMGSSLKVRGKSVFMEDIESKVAAECGITKGKLAAVAIADAGSQGIALFAETSVGEWIAAARTLIRAELGPAQTVTVVTGPRGLIRRTSSGKPRRRHMWDLFTTGELADAVVHEADGTARSPALDVPGSGAGAQSDSSQGGQAPTPSLPAARVAELLDRALAEVSVPAHCAIFFEGSLAEGFGNEGSDVDFLVVAGGAEELPTLPAVLFGDGRRLEVRTRSHSQLRGQLQTVADYAAAGRIGELEEDLLNRCQRFLRSSTLRTSSAVDLSELRGIISLRHFTEVMAQWWRGRSIAALRQVQAMRALAAGPEAAGWMVDALGQAAKSWCAARGETYLEAKWLPRQLDRIGGDVPDRYAALVSERPPRHDDPTWWAAAEALVSELGIDAPEWSDTANIRLARVTGVTTWTVGDRIHVIRGGVDVFALSPDAERAWRQVVFRRPLAEVLGRAPASIPIAECIAEFTALGLVGLQWGNEGVIAPSMMMCPAVEPYSPPPLAHRPVLGLTGLILPADDPAIAHLAPVPATRFASAALELTWANIVAENAREDLVGALKSGQGAVADVAAHRLVAMIARMLLSAWGVHPLPPDVAPSATVRRVIGVRPDARVADELAHAETINFAALLAAGGDGLEALEDLDALLHRVRNLVSGEGFPASFDSREQWRITLEIAYDWVRVGTHLGVRLPLAEAQDLLDTGGAQPHITDGGVQ